MNESQFWAYLFGGASVGVIWLVVQWLKGFKQDVLPKEEKPAEIKCPDYIVRIDVYPDNTATIVATDAYGKDMPIRSQRWFCNDGTSLVGYVPSPHTQQYNIEPPKAKLEASTTLEPVAKTVEEEALDLLNTSTLEDDQREVSRYKKLKQEQIEKGLIDTK